MNPEIHSIVEDMKKRSKKEPIAESDIHTYQLAQMAHLLSLLSQEAETHSEKVVDYSKKIVTFTKVLLWFTGILIFIGLIQIYMMIFKS